jgi:hypothetical protein
MQSTSLVETDDWDTLDAVTGNALRAHRLANGEAGAARIVEVTRNAIRSWRRLGGLSVMGNDPIRVAGVRSRKVVAA